MSLDSHRLHSRRERLTSKSAVDSTKVRTKSAQVHVYEVRPRKDERGVDLISDVLPFGRLWYDTTDNATGYAQHFSRSHDAVTRVYDESGNVIEMHERKGEFKEW